jgi:protocatechuate 3,4-dioxygenase beta subunit
MTAALLVAACTVNGSDEAEAPAEAVAQNQPTSPPETPTAAAVQVEPTATDLPATTGPAATSTSEPLPQPTDTPMLEPTPQCDDHDETPPQTEGPYFTPNTPERTSLLEPGIDGTRLLVSGRVLSTNCEPIAAALLEFWQCDNNGQYDNVGYRLRGHQFTAEDGTYQLETIAPGLYPGRTRHIHVKVQKPNGAVLTSQLYFPDEAANNGDGIFNPVLVMAVEDGDDGQTAAFDFVLA